MFSVFDVRKQIMKDESLFVFLLKVCKAIAFVCILAILLQSLMNERIRKFGSFVMEAARFDGFIPNLTAEIIGVR